MVEKKYKYLREYWTGDSRDGRLIDGDGYHFFKMSQSGDILEAYEYYQKDDGTEVVSPLPEMEKINWFKNLGFENLDILEEITATDFDKIKNIYSSS